MLSVVYTWSVATCSLLKGEANDVPRSEIKLGLAVCSPDERVVAVTDISLMSNVSGSWVSLTPID